MERTDILKLTLEEIERPPKDKVIASIIRDFPPELLSGFLGREYLFMWLLLPPPDWKNGIQTYSPGDVHEGKTPFVRCSGCSPDYFREFVVRGIQFCR